jgi:hypothetical protein
MVMPTFEHLELQNWLGERRIVADEAGGTLIIANLDGLLRLCGSTRRLSKEERALMKAGRARTDEAPDPLLPGMPHLPEPVVGQLHALIGQLRSVTPDAEPGDLVHIASTDPSVRDAVMNPRVAWTMDTLGAGLQALLREVCDALGAAGVVAEPGLGLGSFSGDEILAACVHVVDPSQLYKLMEESIQNSQSADVGSETGFGPGPAPLTLGHVLTSLGSEHRPPIGLEDVLVIRHAFKPSGHTGLQGPADLTEDRVLAYTRYQSISTRKFPAQPPRYWVVLIADGQNRARLFGTYTNHGEVLAERTDEHRFWELRRSDFLEPLNGRLVVDWTSPRSWNRRGPTAGRLPIIEIADRDRIPFPGFDRVLLRWHELHDLVCDPRYADWRAALSEVQGIYLITDETTGKQYVGKADGATRLFGRWSQYAQSGHGGNIALRALVDAAQSAGADLDGASEEHARHFVFSILRVYGPSTPPSEVDAAESHFKDALMTRIWGLNRN